MLAKASQFNSIQWIDWYLVGTSIKRLNVHLLAKFKFEKAAKHCKLNQLMNALLLLVVGCRTVLFALKVQNTINYDFFKMIIMIRFIKQFSYSNGWCEWSIGKYMTVFSIQHSTFRIHYSYIFRHFHCIQYPKKKNKIIIFLL